MRSTVVRDYLKEVKRELFGVDSGGIIEEISSHIDEKAGDIAVERGLKTPDDEVYQLVIDDLGPPEEVVRPYLKELPVRLPRPIKLYLIIQMLTGIAAFLVFIEGMDTLFWALDQTPDDTGFILTQITSNVLFLFIAIVMTALILIQWRKPINVASLGNLSMVFSISVIVTMIFVMYRIMAWNMWGVEYGENQYYPFAGMVMLGFIVLFIFGFQLIERFQRRIHLSGEDIPRLRKDRKRTKILVGAVSSILLILLSAVTIGQSMYSEEYFESHELLITEEIGGPYDARLELWEHREEGSWWEERKIIYYEDEEEIHGAFYPEMQRSLDWIEKSSPTDSKILAWWDYGHAIKGYTGREVLLDDPIWSMSFSVADPSSVYEWEVDENKFINVARALVTTDLNFTSEIMDLYNADYILTNYRDAAGINYALLHAAYGIDPVSSYMPTLEEDSFLYSVWNGKEIEGFEVVYSDLEVRILKRSEIE